MEVSMQLQKLARGEKAKHVAQIMGNALGTEAMWDILERENLRVFVVYKDTEPYVALSVNKDNVMRHAVLKNNEPLSKEDILAIQPLLDEHRIYIWYNKHLPY